MRWIEEHEEDERRENWITFARHGIGKHKIEVLTNIKILIANDLQPQLPYGDWGASLEVHGVEARRAPEFESNWHGFTELTQVSSGELSTYIRREREREKGLWVWGMSHELYVAETVARAVKEGGYI